MKTTKLLCSVAVAAVAFCAVHVPGASAQILSNKWFSLKFAGKGALVDSNGVPTKLSFNIPVFMQFIGTGSNPAHNSYLIHVWTETDAGWTNIVTVGPNTVTTNNNTFISDVGLNVNGKGGDSVHIYHTANVDAKTDKTGAFKSAIYSGIGEINSGSIIIDGATNRFFGGATLKGKTVDSSKLPFTAP